MLEVVVLSAAASGPWMLCAEATGALDEETESALYGSLMRACDCAISVGADQQDTQLKAGKPDSLVCGASMCYWFDQCLVCWCDGPVPHHS